MVNGIRKVIMFVVAILILMASFFWVPALTSLGIELAYSPILFLQPVVVAFAALPFAILVTKQL